MAVVMTREAFAAYIDALHHVPSPTSRRIETGERLVEKKPEMAIGKCYICKVSEASIYFSQAIPQCGVCYDRFRRRD